jgi:WD40 repeat protein
VRVWDAESRKEKMALRGHASFVLAVAVSADGGQVVSAGVDGTVRVWDAATGEQRLTLTREVGAIPGVAASADGRRVVWATGRNASVLAMGGNPTFNGASGSVNDGFTLTGHTDLVYAVAISGDGGRVATASFDGTVKVWAAQTGRELLTLRGHEGPVYGVALGPAGGRVVSGGKDGTVRVWDGATGRLLSTLTGHTGPVNAVAISADGRVVSGGQDGTMKVWDPPTGGPDRQTARAPGQTSQATR